MSLFKADRLCLLCSYRTIELKQLGKVNKDGVVNAQTYQKSNIGLICTKCNGFVCLPCLKALVPAMQKDRNHFQSTVLLDTYLDAIAQSPDHFTTPPNFIGHCCCIDIRLDPGLTTTTTCPQNPPDRTSHLIQSTGTEPYVSASDHEDNNLPCDHQPETISKEGSARLSGCIFFPEFDLFIDSPMKCMDIHAVGAEYNYKKNEMKRHRTPLDPTSKDDVKNYYLHARWHCVISYEHARRIHDFSPLPNKALPSEWETYFLRKVPVRYPHNNNYIKVSNIFLSTSESYMLKQHLTYKIYQKYNIFVIHIKKKHSFDVKRRASNIPTEKELQDGYLFENWGPSRRRPDITLILGSDGVGTHASILLCRYHNLSPSLPQHEKVDLFNNVWGNLNSRKFECRRSGGSSGFVSPNVNNLIKKFISYPGSAPREGKGTVWMRGSDTWYLYYIGTYDGVLKTCKYTNPVPGGSFLLDSKWVEKYAFIRDFICIKPITALMLEAIKGSLLKKVSFQVIVTPQAVKEELMNISETQLVISASQSRRLDRLPLDLEKVPDDVLSKNPIIRFCTIYNRDHVKFTLVCHSVGLHLDVFAKKLASLENKVCFEIHYRSLSQLILMNNHPHGRGGGSTSSHFVFALLDWSGGSRSKRLVWTDPANAHLDHAPRNVNERLTREIWNAFFNNPDIVHVATEVNRRHL